MSKVKTMTINVINQYETQVTKNNIIIENSYNLYNDWVTFYFFNR